MRETGNGEHKDKQRAQRLKLDQLNKEWNRGNMESHLYRTQNLEVGIVICDICRMKAGGYV